MNRQLILLFLLLTLSCSKDDNPDPDLAKNFLGSWKTDVQKTDGDSLWTIYDIERISNDLVKVNVTQYFDSHKGEYYDFTDEYAFDSVKVQGNSILKIKDSRISGPNKITYDGQGILTGNTLTLNLIIDYDNQNYNNLFTIPLTKQ